MGQTEGRDGIATRALWRDYGKQKIAPSWLDQKKLQNFAGTFSDCLFFTCYNLPEWAAFKAECAQLASFLDQVANFMKKDVIADEQFNSNICNSKELIEMSTILENRLCASHKHMRRAVLRFNRFHTSGLFAWVTLSQIYQAPTYTFVG